MLSQRIIAIARGRSVVSSNRASAIVLSRAWYVLNLYFFTAWLISCPFLGKLRIHTPKKQDSTPRNSSKVITAMCIVC